MTGHDAAAPRSAPAFAPPFAPACARDPQRLLEQALLEWGGSGDLWIFGYASLIWRPDFEFAESRLAVVHGWHRALRMWSRINRGTPEVPGLVFALLSGGSCRGVAYRVPKADGEQVLERMWLREMVTAVYDPRWLPCRTTAGAVRALAFTLSRGSPSYTGPMTAAQYHAIFRSASGRYGSTLDYVQATGRTLVERGIRDRALHRLLHEHGVLSSLPAPAPHAAHAPPGTTPAAGADAPIAAPAAGGAAAASYDDGGA